MIQLKDNFSHFTIKNSANIQIGVYCYSMEQHPVPQNISGFQFKLIGDITLKQFSYLAGGVILAYIITKITFVPGIFRYPLAIFTALLGVGLAFVPIEERPLDRWLGAFFKSVYLPTQYVWKKQNPIPEALMEMPVLQPAPITPPKKPTPEITPKTITPAKTVTVPVPKPVLQPVKQVVPVKVVPHPPPLKPLKAAPPKEKADRWTLGAPPRPISTPPQPAGGQQKPITGQKIVFEEKKPVAPTPKPDEKKVEKLKSSYQELEKRLNAQMQVMQEELQHGNVTKERFMELQKILSELLLEKDRMSAELIKLRKQLETKEEVTTVKPSTYKTMPQDTRTTVKIVPPSMATRVGMPQLTTYPNIITGIVKDSNGSLQPGIIITVKDKDDVPVRALKTNRLGQFAASTPLSNGVYIIEVEDPKKTFRFERIEVSLSNQVLPPLEISAISEKDVMRQKLNQEIFGKNRI